MQWASTNYFGFSEVEPWISLPDNDVTVENQLNNPESMLTYYRKLLQVRKEIPTFTDGSYERLELENNLLLYERAHEGSSAMVYLHFSDEPVHVSLNEQYKPILSSRRNTIVNDKTFEILPFEAIIMTKKEEDPHVQTK